MKTALVTGANKGIGLQVARQLAERGFRVFLGARKTEAGLAAAAKLAGDNPGEVTFVRIDVSDSASVAAAAKEVGQATDHLDVLVNNAGIVVDGDSSILSTTDEILRETLETNTLGPLRVTRAFVPLLEKARAPRVVNVSSGAGQLDGGADGWAPAYCISKTALNGVTSQLAHGLKHCAVNSVCPGWVRTDMGGANATRSVEQGADTIVWLATDAPHSLTGQYLRDRKPLAW